MAKEYIEREAFREVLRRSHEAHANNSREEVLLERDIRLLMEQPAADVVEVKHGEWIGEGDGYSEGEIVIDVWYCSECGHCIDEGIDDPHILPNYCPNCGAKMDGGGNHAED